MTAACRPILWTPIWNTARAGVGLEHLLLGDRSADSVIVTFDEDDRPFRLAYQLAWDEAWRLRHARLVVTDEQGSRTLVLETDGRARWRDGDGRALPRLDGCTDLDIWPTPFTNTFPLRRQPMAIGEHRDIVAAWVSAPALTVDPVPQRYTRLADRRYLFENRDGSGFRAELPVDDDGVVLDYEGSFRRVL
jgi:hypothetical protein